MPKLQLLKETDYTGTVSYWITIDGKYTNLCLTQEDAERKFEDLKNALTKPTIEVLKTEELGFQN